MTSYDPTQLQGTTAVGPDGDKIGAVKQVYINDTTNEPEWVTVSTGLFGTKESFAPLSGSRLEPQRSSRRREGVDGGSDG